MKECQSFNNRIHFIVNERQKYFFIDFLLFLNTSVD